MKQLLIDFLDVCYPIQKIKIKGRFKRVIITEHSTYSLSDNDELRELSYSLLRLLNKIFCLNDQMLMKSAIIYHLGLR
jgi:hypothetical protein